MMLGLKMSERSQVLEMHTRIKGYLAVAARLVGMLTILYGRRTLTACRM
jgi:hypothetical protein